MKQIVKLSLTLAFVGALAALVLGITYSATKTQIDKQAIIKQNNANANAIKADSFKKLSDSEIKNKNIKLDNEQDKIFIALKNKEKVGYAILVHPRGYGGLMEIVVGIKEGKINGVSMVSNKETPGLGDAVFAPKFIKQYINLTSDDPVVVKKDIDAITGATISSKALTKGVRIALNYYIKLEK